MVQEAFVSFETAKLLKEKGFDEKCLMAYIDGELFNYYDSDFPSEYELENDGSEVIDAPTQQMALRWLREVHGIFNQVQHFWKANKYECYPYSIKNGKHLHDFHLGYHDTYEEACETAIKYCLTKVN